MAGAQGPEGGLREYYESPRSQSQALLRAWVHVVSWSAPRRDERGRLRGRVQCRVWNSALFVSSLFVDLQGGN